MSIIKRKMQVEETKQEQRYIRECCLASINSDGRITLINYRPENKNEDEMFVLSEQETAAIFALMRVLGGAVFKNADLPF